MSSVLLSRKSVTVIRHGQVAVRHLAGRPELPNLESKGEETKRGRIKRRLFQRFFDYLGGYDETILKKLVPKIAVEAYRTFSTGSRKLIADMNEFSKVYIMLSTGGEPEYLTRRQLELYMTLPRELIRVAPALIVSALPMAQNVVFPVAIKYPKLLLSSHFWTDEVAKEVAEERVKYRHHHYSPTFRILAKIIRPVGRLDEGDSTYNALRKLSNGSHPTPDEILAMKDQFSCAGRLSVKKLSALHKRRLIRMHENVGLTANLFTVRNLKKYGNLLHAIDKAILREGIDNMDAKSLERCCQLRGLNTKSLMGDDMKEYLESWLYVSDHLEGDSTSLLLHLPLFLGYNHKTRFKWHHK